MDVARRAAQEAAQEAARKENRTFWITMTILMGTLGLLGIAAVVSTHMQNANTVSPSSDELPPADDAITNDRRPFQNSRRSASFSPSGFASDSPERSRCLSRRPDMESAIRELMSSHDAMETFCERSLEEPDMMRLVLVAGVSALVNTKSIQALEAELKRRSA